MRAKLMLLAALTACSTPPTGPGEAPASGGAPASAGAPASTAAPVVAGTPVVAAAPAVDAAALFDEAIKAELDGDALEARDRWIRLAAAAPHTPQGRYAARAAGGGEFLGVVGMVGVLSAIAIPAFMKYTQRAKTSEATMNLRKMFDSSVAYYNEEHVGPDGQVLPRRFPARTELSPQRSACFGSASVALQPDAELWATPGWLALNFAIEEPSYYQYQYISEGEGTSARFTARAIGDLDCDGVFSTFERTATVDADGNINGGAGIFTKDELE